MRFRDLWLSLTVLVLVAGVVFAQPPQLAMVVPAKEEEIPTIQLPPSKPIGVAKYDPDSVKIKNHPYFVTLVKALEAWAMNPAAKGEGVNIAIVDTYAQPDHPLYKHLVKGQYSAITKKLNPPKQDNPHDHGTHVAGIVAQILPKCNLYLIEVLDRNGSGRVDHIAHGIDYATTEFKCDLTNCSLGGPTADRFLPPAIKRATEAGNIVVCAAGNEGGGPGRDTEGYPARYPESISVAACDSRSRLASFSSWGPNVYLAAPGVAITSSLPNNLMGEMDGTSMACPVATGELGCWVATNGVPRDKDRYEKVRKAIIKACPFEERNNARGHGLMLMDKLVGSVNKLPTPTPPTPTPGEKVYVLDLTKLKADGYTTVRIIGVGGGPHSEADTTVVPVASKPVPTWNGDSAAPVMSPPPTVYQQMPGCPGGVCSPQPLFPVINRLFRR